MDEIEQMERIAQYNMYEYKIYWSNGQVDKLGSNDIPENWRVLVLDKIAIISASDPLGIPIIDEIINEQTNKLENILKERKLNYAPVDRIALDPVTFQPVGKVTKSFIIFDIEESEAETIANYFGAPFILYFSMDPDVHIEIVLCPIVKGQIRGLYFYFND